MNAPIRRRLAAVMLTVGTLSFGATAAVGAPQTGGDRHSTSTVTETVTLETPAQSRARDVSVVARTRGMTLAEASAFLDRSVDFGERANLVAETWPDAYAGSFFTEDGTATIRFATSTPTGLDTIVETAGYPISIVENAGRSLADLRGIHDDAHQAVADTLSDQIIVSWVDQVTGRIVIGVPDEDAVVPARTATTSQDGDADLIDVITPTGPNLGWVHSRGGGQFLDDGAIDCTAGFALTTTYGSTPTGVSTAAHCEGINGYRESASSSYSAPWKNEKYGGTYGGELEWHSTSHNEYANFHVSSSSIRPVTSVEPASNIQPGESVCFYGRASNTYDNWCTAVDEVRAQITDPNFPPCRCKVTIRELVLMSANEYQAGDSGGPVYINNRAYGSISANFGYGDMWSPIEFVSHMGMRVATS